MSLDLYANGTPVWIEGLPGEYTPLPLDPQKGIKLSFALQSLDFVGHDSGCDLLTAKLRFWRDGEQVGKMILLERPYVALRNAQPLEFKIGEWTIDWTGTYIRPANAFEYEVFVQSVPAQEFEDGGPRSDIQRALNRARASISDLGLRFEGRPVVGVVRPPLRTATYGIVLGLLQPEGRVQFTFAREGAHSLLNFALGARDAEDQRIRSLIGADSFIYRIRGTGGAGPSVCGHAPAKATLH